MVSHGHDHKLGGILPPECTYVGVGIVEEKKWPQEIQAVLTLQVVPELRPFVFELQETRKV